MWWTPVVRKVLLRLWNDFKRGTAGEIQTTNYQMISDSKIRTASMILRWDRGPCFWRAGCLSCCNIDCGHFFTTLARGDDGTASHQFPSKNAFQQGHHCRSWLSEAGFVGCFAKFWVFQKGLWDIRGSRARNVDFSRHLRFFSKSRCGSWNMPDQSSF